MKSKNNICELVMYICKSCDKKKPLRFFIRSHGFRAYSIGLKKRRTCNICSIRKMISRKLISLKGINLEDFSIFELLAYLDN